MPADEPPAAAPSPAPLPLLCEFCGYCIDGLPETANCPECGRAVFDSLPERRTGSPWQINQSNASAREAWRLVRMNPAAAFGVVTIARTAQASLASRSAWYSGLLVVSPLMVLAAAATLLKAPWFGGIQAILGGTLLALAVWPAVSLATLTLVLIERSGVQFFGRRRGWRVTPVVAAVVCNHASPAWVIGARIWSIAWCLVLSFIAFTPPMAGYEVQWILLLPFAGPLVGLIWFEILVYTGIRRCRFANPPRMTPAAPPLPPAPLPSIST